MSFVPRHKILLSAFIKRYIFTFKLFISLSDIFKNTEKNKDHVLLQINKYQITFWLLISNLFWRILVLPSNSLLATEYSEFEKTALHGHVCLNNHYLVENTEEYIGASLEEQNHCSTDCELPTSWLLIQSEQTPKITAIMSSLSP